MDFPLLLAIVAALVGTFECMNCIFAIREIDYDAEDASQAYIHFGIFAVVGAVVGICGWFLLIVKFFELVNS